MNIYFWLVNGINLDHVNKVQLNSELGQEGPKALKIDFEYM